MSSALPYLIILILLHHIPCANLQFPLPSSPGHVGFDSDCAEVITKAQCTTIKNFGYEYFIAKFFDGTRVTNPNTFGGLWRGVHLNGIRSVKNCRDAGITRLVDVYHIPALTAVVPSKFSGSGNTNVYDQARIAIDQLNKRGAKIGRVWLVVLGWGNNIAQNEAFLTEFSRHFPNPLGPHIGILTTREEFSRSVSPNYVPRDSNSQQLQLWWANYFTGFFDYTNFVPFNFWSTPVMHRYQCFVNNLGGAPGVSGCLNWFA